MTKERLLARGAGIRWRLRAARPLIHRPVAWARHRGLTADDVFLAGYPKSGNTWVAFVLAEAIFGHEVDFETQARFIPGVGRHHAAPAIAAGRGRLLRTHERYRGDYRRAIYVVRNVADVAVSYFNHQRLFGIDVEFDEFFQTFLRGRVDGYGTWWSHVESWVDASNLALLVVRYEDLRANPEPVMSRVLEFVGVPVVQERLRVALEHNTLERMRVKEDRARERLEDFQRLHPQYRFIGSSAGERRSLLTPRHLETLSRKAGNALRRLGYDVDVAS